jgi:hypothetical protein
MDTHTNTHVYTYIYIYIKSYFLEVLITEMVAHVKQDKT